jgi:protein-S-isoprenylcysteine O-methyltransferase Ste14
MPHKTNGSTGRLDRAGISRILVVFSMLMLYAVILFGLAGRLDWWEAWVFLVIYLAGILANGLYALRHDAEVINERGRIGKDVKSWDKVIGIFYMIFLFATFILAGLDARFTWSVVPLGIKILGGMGFIISLFLTFWAMTTNTFLSTFVRIQAERGHTTVTGGPYRFIRHPMYAGTVCMAWGVPLLLGSLWALIPGVLIIFLLIIRTSLEDRTLRAELPGYAEYSQKVRYRWIPGIW